MNSDLKKINDIVLIQPMQGFILDFFFVKGGIVAIAVTLKLGILGVRTLLQENLKDTTAETASGGFWVHVYV